MDILEEYKKQLEAEKLLEEAEDGDQSISDDVKEKIKEIKNDPNDIYNAYKRFHDTYDSIRESDLKTKECLRDEAARIHIRRAYCPKCGKEIVSTFPIMINPYTNERIGRYECACGQRMNLEYSYPRVVYVTDNGEEVVIQS